MKRLLVDMDGVMAEFNQNASIEELYEPGYFEKLPCIQNVVDAVKLIAERNNDIEVCVLSAVFDNDYAEKEKNAWIDRVIPCIDRKHRFFCKYGENKKEFVKAGEQDYLLDDFTHNLNQWTSKKGIKCYNGINGTKGTWTGYSIHSNMLPSIMASQIEAIIKYS